MKMIVQNLLKTVGFLQKYSDIKTPAPGFDFFNCAEHNQAFSPPPNHSNFRRQDLQFVMSQIQENNCSPNEPSVVALENSFFLTKYFPLEWTLRFVTV